MWRREGFPSIALVALVAITTFAPAPIRGAEATADLVAGNTQFACDLYAKLRGGEGNIFFSPYSISTVAAMAWAGARGETGRQMAGALHFTQSPDQVHAGFAALQAELDQAQAGGKVALTAANSLWPQRGEALSHDYLALVKRHYGVDITPVDYKAATEKARQMINAWVERETRDKIRDLVPAGALTPLTRLVLANAVYFKGAWLDPFEPEATQEQPFFVTPARRVQAPLMRQTEEFLYADLDSLQALQLPYAGGRLSMLVLLPKERDGLLRLERALTAEALARWRAALLDREVRLFLPRFKLTCQFGLGETLASLGMTDAFDGAKADFSGMNGRAHDLYVSAVLHKAFVDVGEEGTEAAAATGMVLGATAAIIPAAGPAVFRADHPFLFLIQDDGTGSVLFLGRVVDPTASG